MSKSVLLIGRGQDRERLAAYLSAHGFLVRAIDGVAGMKAHRERPLLAVILDRSAHEASRAELQGHLRALPPPGPGVILLDPALPIGSTGVAGPPSSERRVRWTTPERVLVMVRDLEIQRDSAGADKPDSDPPAAPSSRNLPGPDLSPVILVVDDSLTFRTALSDSLRSAGCEVLLAGSGRQALDQLSRRVPDAIVLDLVMPDMDGLDTCRNIRFTRDKLPILMLTANDQIRARMETRAAGASEFLVKENDFTAVVAGVLDFVRRVTAGSRPKKAASPGADPAAKQSLFSQVVAASGLSPVIAEAAIVRTCQRAGIDARSMSMSDLQRVLPDVQRALRTFLPPDALASRYEALEALVTRPAGFRPPGDR